MREKGNAIISFAFSIIFKYPSAKGWILHSLSNKETKNYGFLKMDEQLNIIFALMLYIMEQSLKEENCTLDDIGAFLDHLNTTYFYKNMSYEDCKKIGDFIINVILSNEGKAMYFDGFDFEFCSSSSAALFLTVSR